ncbi:hypothetical protein [Nocardia sp. AG03]|uniref:hypothetical protein n=1 Tax=Nocardia sp. AG03 TaxID=3025312 RepID=UPI002418A414|nr:hypothetical protein [Nocardia sp. AG03]
MAEEINYGQAEIGGFVQRSGTGEFSFEPDEARAAVREIDAFIKGLSASRLSIRNGETVTGFGTLPSGIELQEGFRNKANSAGNAINQLIQGAMQVQEGFLRSAGLLEDADDLSARRIALADRATEDGQ